MQLRQVPEASVQRGDQVVAEIQSSEVEPDGSESVPIDRAYFVPLQTGDAYFVVESEVFVGEWPDTILIGPQTLDLQVPQHGTEIPKLVATQTETLHLEQEGAIWNMNKKKTFL